MDDEAFFKDDITKGKLSGAIPLLGGQEALKRPEGVCSGRSQKEKMAKINQHLKFHHLFLC